MSRLADHVPPACSGCFQQDLKARHVDFDVAYDGPSMMNPQGGHQPIDDLILCEKCLMDAGRHVGLGPVESLTAAMLEAKDAQAEAEDRAMEAESRLAAMEAALETLRIPAPSAPEADAAPAAAGARGAKVKRS